MNINFAQNGVRKTTSDDGVDVSNENLFFGWCCRRSFAVAPFTETCDLPLIWWVISLATVRVARMQKIKLKIAIGDVWADWFCQVRWALRIYSVRRMRCELLMDERNSMITGQCTFIEFGRQMKLILRWHRTQIQDKQTHFEINFNIICRHHSILSISGHAIVVSTIWYFYQFFTLTIVDVPITANS